MEDPFQYLRNMAAMISQEDGSDFCLFESLIEKLSIDTANRIYDLVQIDFSDMVHQVENRDITREEFLRLLEGSGPSTFVSGNTITH